MMPTRNSLHKDTHRLKGVGKKIYWANRNQNQAGIAILIYQRWLSGKQTLNKKIINKVKKDILIKDTFQ